MKDKSALREIGFVRLLVDEQITAIRKPGCKCNHIHNATIYLDD